MNKNLDLTLGKEKPIVKEISASFVCPFVPNRDQTSKNIAEQNPSLAGGQDDLKATGSDGTSLTGDPTSLAGAANLTGDKAGLTGTSIRSGSSSKAKNKIRPSFEELLAKYEKEESA